MVVIKGINVSEIEEQLKYISEGAAQIKVYEEELENIEENLKDNDKEFKNGKISREMYNDTKSVLKKKIDALTVNINKLVSDVLILLEELNGLVSECKV